MARADVFQNVVSRFSSGRAQLRQRAGQRQRSRGQARGALHGAGSLPRPDAGQAGKSCAGIPAYSRSAPPGGYRGRLPAGTTGASTTAAVAHNSLVPGVSGRTRTGITVERRMKSCKLAAIALLVAANTSMNLASATDWVEV